MLYKLFESIYKCNFIRGLLFKRNNEIYLLNSKYIVKDYKIKGL